MSADLTSAAIAVLERLVAFDTTSRNSNLALVDWVEAYLADHGVASRRVLSDDGQKANLIATIGPSDRPAYVLSGHTDVVPVDGQTWASDPFVLTERDGRLYGRGACDMKGFLACVLAMVPTMVARPLTTPFVLAFSYDEEVGCLGAPRLVADLVATGPVPRACFVGEPTAMDVVIGHKSKRSYIVEVTGRAAHSSLAPLAVNALEYAALLIAEIRRVGADLARTGPRDPLYDVPVTTAHTGVMRSGTVLNLVPDHAYFEYEFRGLGSVDVDALAAGVERYARTVLEPEMRAVAPETGFTFRERSHFPGLETAPDAPIVALAKGLARRNSHAKVAYGTEAGLFSNAGIPTVVIGPGAIAQAHIEDEFIARSELTQCLGFLGRLLDHAAGS